MMIPILHWWIMVLLSSSIKSFRCLTIPRQSRFICQASCRVNNTVVKGSKSCISPQWSVTCYQGRCTSASFCNCCVFCLKVCRELFSSCKEKIHHLQAENRFEWLHLQKKLFAFCCVFVVALLNDLESGDDVLVDLLEYCWWQSDGQSILLGRESSGMMMIVLIPHQRFWPLYGPFKQIELLWRIPDELDELEGKFHAIVQQITPLCHILDS